MFCAYTVQEFVHDPHCQQRCTFSPPSYVWIICSKLSW